MFTWVSDAYLENGIERGRLGRQLLQDGNEKFETSAGPNFDAEVDIWAKREKKKFANCLH
jgi:hypothetical protein